MCLKKTSVVTAFLLVLSICAGAQETKTTTGAAITERPKSRLEKLREYRELSQIEPLGTVLDGPIDPAFYLVGPGDVLSVGIWNILAEEGEFPVPVLPEGVVSVPGFPNIDVNGMTLEETEETIRSTLGSQFRDAVITVALRGIRTFKVYITGEVELPGEFSANATTRVSSLIEQSLGLSTWADGRNIDIRHVDGSTDSFDYYRYLSEGKRTDNPVVRGGDIIYVPGGNFSNSILLATSGEVAGFYQYHNNETVFDFLKRTEIINYRLDLGNITIERTGEDGGTEAISLNLNDSSRQFSREALILLPGDKISIPRIDEFVFVYGSVQEPGEIIWEPGRKASYYIGFAGKTDAAISRLKYDIIRDNVKYAYKDEDVPVLPGDQIFIPRRKYLIFREYLEFASPLISLVIAAKAVGLIK